MNKLLFIFLLLIVACAQIPDECVNVPDAADRDYCVLELALNTSNSDYCDVIKNTNWQTWCYTDLAEQTNNVDLCDNLEDNYRNHCVKNIAINLINENLCPSGSVAADECFRMIAINKNDSNICTSVVDVNQRNQCYSEISINTYDVELCKKITYDVELKDTCYFKIAMRTENVDTCMNIFVKARREACIVNRAVTELDWDLCSYIDDSEVKSSCEAIVNDARSKT